MTNRFARRAALFLTVFASAAATGVAHAQDVRTTLFNNVRVFDGKASSLSKPTNVLVRGNLIVLEPHLVAAGYPRGVRYLRGVDVVTVVQLAPSILQVPDLYEGYCQAHGQVPLPDFLFALATTVARRWLVAQ